ncbi:hypothetical protein OG895_32465 [Streptomyces sp. NBC_00201]|uniref:hypothetical protein n=1 Tax=unclassified Streptomyces TaxID=2593676 RepID=UPI002251A422|nr:MULTISPECIES: hypothetical protein [unclassified Streptomyces]MCX5051983.1 hypothetical protein [Streptomyces sp. NBC_00474]MCX5249878.1 hypothetical protein [Streptomyces sp. NBC_00201]
MPRNPLFSTYRTGENRVTSSTMAVFERIDLALVQELLETATAGAGELPTVFFHNQVMTDEAIPDARISARFTWWFETKTVRGAYAGEGHGRSQLRAHARQLDGDASARLFVLTPDPARPAWFAQFDGVPEQVRDRVLWLSFRDLATAIEAVVTNPARLVGEQTRFLLYELIALYEAEGLLTNDDTVIVAARSAWPEYQRLAAYVCQPGRSFREGLTHFGFYTDGVIQPLLARIHAHHTEVLLTREEAERHRSEGHVELADLIGTLVRDGYRPEGGSNGIFLLSAPGDPDTVQLGQPILNDTVTETGRPWAWTLGQRYTSLDRLKTATRTSDL